MQYRSGCSVFFVLYSIAGGQLSSVALDLTGVQWPYRLEQLPSDGAHLFDIPGASARDDVAMIVGGIDQDGATHAVWSVGADGAISSAGLLRIDTGDAATSVVFDGVRDLHDHSRHKTRGHAAETVAGQSVCCFTLSGTFKWAYGAV